MANPLGTLPGASMGTAATQTGVKKKRPAVQQPGQQAAQPAQQQTFAEMQQAGRARPAPPAMQPATQTGVAGQPMQQRTLGGLAGYGGQPQGGGYNPVAGQLQGAVSNALQSPSRYDLPQVQQVRDSLTADLSNQFGKIRDTTNTNLAQRGLAASTFGANDLHDVDAAQSRAMSDMNAQLTQNYAATQAQDLSASLGAGQNYQNALNANQINQGNLGIAQQNANTSQAGTMGNLALGEKGLAQSGSQFDKSLAQSGSQFGQTLAEQQAGRLQSGEQFNMQQALADKLGTGGLDLQRQGLAQSGSQFDKSLAQSGQQFGQTLAEQQAGRLQSGQQFDASQAQQGQQFNMQQALADKLGTGGLDIQRMGLKQSGEQFGQSLAEQQAARLQSGQQFGQTMAQNANQFGQTLAEQQAGRVQSGEQFTAGQSQNASQFGQSMTFQEKQAKQNQLSGFLNAALQGGVQIDPEILKQLYASMGMTPPAAPIDPVTGKPKTTGSAGTGYTGGNDGMYKTRETY